ncbi:MAG: amidohydrolase family protein [Bacteroidetes bacterium]|nr:amidohydrolase family protein [Bacteroidota bacterium]
MQSIILRLITVVWLLFLLSCSGAEDRSTADLLITNATIVDGSGGERVTGSILVEDGIITKIGEIASDEYSAAITVDADGRVVSPGFIDTHSHGDPLETPRFDNFLSMGVTTITLGQDGSSPRTDNVSGWMDDVDRQGTGPNILYFAGHNSLRRLVDAPRQSNLDTRYIIGMQELLKNAMADGAFGLTTGLEYDHGRFADLPELVALGETVAETNGVVMSHMRNEDDDQIEDSVRELLQQGRESGVSVHASHIKIVFGDTPRQAESVLALMQEARNEGLTVTADLYPYTASYTGIAILFPDWALPPNDYDEVVKNRREELADYLRELVNKRNGPEATLFGTEPWAGQTLADLADTMNKPFEDVLIEDIGPSGASAAYFVMDEEVMRQFLTGPYVMVSSDGSPTMHHPRGYGSFAKIIRQYVSQEELLSLEEAIYKMSGLPAETLGLSDPATAETRRGLIREGFAADLLIFDPAAVTDNATFEDPHAYAEGFDWVFVNGKAVIEEGERNDLLPAGVLRRNSR